MSTAGIASSATNSRTHRMIWRWHFYAGLFCTPFVIWLSVTGAIYLFKPQFEAWRDRPYAALAEGARASASAQTAAALAAVPGAGFKAYELPPAPDAAARVVLDRGTEELRVTVHPQTLQILRVQDSREQLMQVIHDLHGSLLLGDRGSMLIELAASWAIVMILTGLYLWWPRGTLGLGGLVYPRLNLRGRLFWRDLHAVVGLWVSAFTLLLLISGLPWTSFWGDNLKALRQLGSSTVVQDWKTSAARPPPAEDAHAEHRGQHGGGTGVDLQALDRLVTPVAALNLAPPVRIIPPSKKSPRWTAQSLSQDRRQRVSLVLDEAHGTIVERKNFADKKLLDRIIGIGISIHEGQMFGWLNQLLGLATALALTTLGVSGYVMWWKRRPQGLLGAPPALAGSRVSPLLLVIAAVLGLLLPMLGLSMIAVLLAERWLLRRIPATRTFLGLRLQA